MRHDEVRALRRSRIDRADGIADEALQFAHRLLVGVERPAPVGTGRASGPSLVAAGHRSALPRQLPERIATVAMPAPTSSVPPVRLKMRIALGLRDQRCAPVTRPARSRRHWRRRAPGRSSRRSASASGNRRARSRNCGRKATKKVMLFGLSAVTSQACAIMRTPTTPHRCAARRSSAPPARNSLMPR